MFLNELKQNEFLNNSEVLEIFLTKQDGAFTAGSCAHLLSQFDRSYLLDLTKVFTETDAGLEQSYLLQASKLMYGKFAGTVEQQMVKAFGDFVEPAKVEMGLFSRQEDYIRSL